MKRPESCSACFESEERLKHNILSNRPQWRSDNREIYFAPCGNHHLFGLFNNGRTPKVVIMGITTSRSAKDNFRSDFKERSHTDLSFDETLRESCIANTFNSGLPLFHRNLSKIFELSGIHKLIGIENPVAIDERLFRKCVNDEKCSNNEKKLLENIYFSQSLICSSCESSGGRKALGNKAIDYNHKNCLNAQVQIVESFNSQVDLWVSLGMKNPITQSKEGHLEHKWLKRRIDLKCNNYVRIANIGGAFPGWTQLEIFEQMLGENPNIDREAFLSKVEEHYRDSKRRFRAQVINCAKQLMQLRDIVRSLVS